MSDLSIFSNFYSVIDALKRSMSHLVPPAEIKPSEWAEKNIKIPVGNAIAAFFAFLIAERIMNEVAIVMLTGL